MVRLKTELRLQENKDVIELAKRRDRKIKIIHALLVFLLASALLASIIIMSSPGNRVADETCSQKQAFKKTTSFTEGSFMLLVGVFDAVVFTILLRFTNRYIVEKHSEAIRRKIRLVFAVFASSVLLQIIYLFSIALRYKVFSS